MTVTFSKLVRRLSPVFAVALLVAAMGGTWSTAALAAPTVQQAITKPSAAPAKPGNDASGADEPPAKKSGRKQITGKLNLNTANEEQLQLLPTVGPAKAERIIAWRAKNGG